MRFERSYHFIFQASIIACLTLILSACQWGGDGNSDDEDNIISEGGNETDVNIDIGNEAGDVFDTESSLYTLNFLSFDQDINNEKNSRFSLYFDIFNNAESSVEPDDDEDQRSNDLGQSQSTWTEELFVDTYNIEWLSISSPYTAPNSHYALARAHQSLQLSGTNEGQLNNVIYSRNYPLIEAIKDNIFEHHLGMTFIWDLDGLGDINKKEDLALDKFSDYETFEGYTLLEHASIWGDNERFSAGALLYSGIKKVNSEQIVVESLLSGNEYTMAAASFDGTGKTIGDLPIDYDHLGAARLAFTYTLDFITQHSIFLSFDSATSTAYYHLDAGSDAIASSSYSINTTRNLLSVNTQNLSSTPTAGTAQSELLEQLNLTAFFNVAFVGPYLDDSSAERFYMAKQFIASTEENSANQTPVFYFNPQAYADIQAQFLAWRDDLLDDAY